MDIKEKINTIFDNLEANSGQFYINEKIIQHEYLVDGELKKWDGALQEVQSPICESLSNNIKRKIIGAYPLLTEKESREVLNSSLKAYDNGCGLWPTMTVEARIKCMENFVREMNEEKSFIVKLIMWEIGKNSSDAEKEFDRTVEYIKDTIKALKELDRQSSQFVIEQGIIAKIRRSPLGIVLCMGPFNYPLNETFATLIPALIMGNVVIFKPPKFGVLLHYPLLKAFQKSFPNGVVNTIYGDGEEVVTPLLKSGKVNSLAFIGSSRVADILKHQHPKPHRLKCVLGLEAKNAAIILADADIDLALNEVLLGALSYNGQRCTALKIIFVHQKIIDNFNDKLCEKIKDLKIGLPWEKDVNITPLPEDNKITYLTNLVNDAKEHGSKVINEFGGCSNETFFYPAVLYPVNEKMKIYYEEQFGPIIPIVPFDEIKTPLQYIIDSNYGQQVSIFGTDPNTIANLIDPLVNQVCRVNINSQCQRGPDTFPFTGRKDSAEATLSVSDALKVFTIRALVAAKENKTNKEIIKKILKEDLSSFISTDFIL